MFTFSECRLSRYILKPVFGMGYRSKSMIPKYGNIFRLDITVMITQSNELLCLASLIWSDLMIRQKYERNPSCLNALNAR